MSFSTVIKYGILSQGGVPVPSFPTNGLTAYYRFNETSGTDASEQVNSYDGTASNSSIWNASGKNNGCIDCASSYYVEIPSSDIDSIYATTGLSVSTWFYYDTSNVGGVLLALGGGFSDERTFRLSVSEDNFRVLLGNSSGAWSWTSFLPDVTGLTNTAWNHVVCTIEGGTGFKIYVNGVLEYTNTTWTDTMSNGHGISGLIGAARDGSNVIDYFQNNKIDEMALYNRPITQEEVTLLYNSGAGLFY